MSEQAKSTIRNNLQSVKHTLPMLLIVMLRLTGTPNRTLPKSHSFALKIIQNKLCFSYQLLSIFKTDEDNDIQYQMKNVTTNEMTASG